MNSLTKEYGNIRAIDNITFEAETGKILTILGPSGAGKTTVLRCIAGLEIPDAGQISIGESVVFCSEKRIIVPPEKRRIGMVFQSYAVWPNMTAFDNIAYPLKIRKRSQKEIRERVTAVLSLVKLDGLEKRYGTELSAGQQQRVAFARAIVSDPILLLLDEPLSNLDAKLREHMRVELKELQRRLGITTMYVTHDHSEAFALSNKILVMIGGKTMAFGAPRELWESPPSLRVADFLGHSNILSARVIENHQDETARVMTPLGVLLLRITPKIEVGNDFHICLRGRMINLSRSKPVGAVNVARGIVRAVIYRGGDNVDYVISVNDSNVRIHGKFMVEEPLNEGEEVYLEIPVEACTTISTSK